MANLKDSLGDRMKHSYENRTRYFLPRRTNTIIRIDGKAFHTYTRNLVKPFDLGLIEDMITTTLGLCKSIQGAKIGYVQSDEISILLTDYNQLETDAWFDGNIQKICSVSASIATALFNKLRFNRYNTNFADEDSWDHLPATAHFDSRVFSIPEKEEVANYFLWRSQDASRNSVQMFARSYFSHQELEGKSILQIHEMLEKKQQSWHSLHDVYKHGTYLYPVNENGASLWKPFPLKSSDYKTWSNLIFPHCITNSTTV